MSSQNPEPPKRRADSLRQLSMAMELPFVMIGWIVVAGGAGYLLDRWLHTSPALMLVGGAFGFGAGMWDLIRRLSREERKQGDGRGGG
jgi:F0F1-type ATP synthase assembly protein I